MGAAAAAALIVLSVGVAAAGWRLAPQTGQTVIAPHTLTSATYRSGLDTLMIDLRHTQLPATGTVSLRIEAGIRRTIVVLPHDRCVRLDVTSHADPYLARAAWLLSGRPEQSFYSLYVFGTPRAADGTDVKTGGPSSAGPLLRIDFTSMGGGLVVRDWPDAVNPETQPYWPGFPVQVEPRPDTTGMTPSAARQLLAGWRRRAAAQRQEAAALNSIMPGLCGWNGSGG
jgi:hypothetical protein